MKCKNCQAEIDANEQICPHCGHLQSLQATSTLIIKLNPADLRTRRLQMNQLSDINVPQGFLALQVRGMIQRIPLNEIVNSLVGRSDVERGFMPDIDLINYGAMDRGVSRSHATLHFSDGKLTLTDLNSANGTFVNGDRLKSNSSIVVNDRDEITLGRLNLNVRISLDGSEVD
jgi:RNA polymerase subunit RPABC4/transcription elongation factor Spt4